MDMTVSDSRPFCACSTPPGTSGIAMIRVSGEGAGKILDRCIRIIRTSSDAERISDMPGYTSAYAEFYDPSDKSSIDKVIITRYTAPHSYTGSEMADISCHGGTAVKQEILSVLISLGMRYAEPGEFTKTAFTAGKLDINEAEAVMSVINAESEAALKAANSQLNGRLSKRLAEAEDLLYRAMALIEMIVEFPEHDDTPENDSEVISLTTEARDIVAGLRDSYGKGRILTESLRIALCGLPNSGKSSLLNALAGYDRAIVTDIPGTTRDTLELTTQIKGIPVTLIDTAGIRRTGDKVEAIGVERARQACADSDLTIYLAACDEDADEITAQMKELFENNDNSKVTLVFSKSDLGINPGGDKIRQAAQDLNITAIAEVSSEETIRDEAGLAQLKDLITDYYEKAGGSSSSDIIVLAKRHSDLLAAAAEQLDMAISTATDGLGVDIMSSVIRAALDNIGKITGKTVSAELADTIFAGFCIGK